MTGRDCYFDANGCYVCPELPAVPGVAPSVVVDPQLGWNAGANSVAMLAGDVHVVWQFDVAPVGVVVGLKASRTLPAEPALMPHGLYVHSAGANSFVTVQEQGQALGEAVPYTLGTPLEIRRVGGVVTYWANGVLLRQSPARTLAPVCVNTCLYSAGDTVP